MLVGIVPAKRAQHRKKSTSLEGEFAKCGQLKVMDTLTGQLIVVEVQLLQLRQLSDLGRDGVLKMEVRSQTPSTIGSVTNAKRRVRGTHWPAGCAGG
jgi:hypothetical protein